MKLHPWLEADERQPKRYGTALSAKDHTRLIAEGHARAQADAYDASVWVEDLTYWDNQTVRIAGHFRSVEAFSLNEGETWYFLTEEEKNLVNCYSAKDSPLRKLAIKAEVADFSESGGAANKAASLLDMLFTNHGTYPE